MITVLYYYQKDCSNCERLLSELKNLQSEYPHNLVSINVDDDPVIRNEFGDAVPAIQVGPYHLKSPFTSQDLRVAMSAARDREEKKQQMNSSANDLLAKKEKKLSSADKISYWLSKHYMFLFNLVVFLYLGLPFASPVLMKVNLETPARIIYTVYSPLCHQLAFRSLFLFGEQPFYPRELAGVEGYASYEEVTQEDEIQIFFARRFEGNEVLGYKVAICQRCIAIYGSLLLFGLVFSLFGRKIKPIPWYIWVLLGLLPVGIDGVSQLPGFAGDLLPDWVLIRESTPYLRGITGGLFGLTTAWYLYPFIEESMIETRAILVKKIAIAEQIQESK